MHEIRSCGDAAFVMAFGERPDRALTQRMMALREALLAASPPGLIEIIPGLAALTFVFDPEITSTRAMAALAETYEGGIGHAPWTARLWEIPVYYGEDLAPDLENVANACGMSTDEVVALHTGREYAVYLIGFSPGFPYLGDINSRLALSRRVEPRTRVPAGSVAIADRYTAIYPQETPGGWHIIGRTPLVLFDAGRASPSLLQAGDTVRFRRVSRAEYEALAARVAGNSYTPAPLESSP